MGIPIPIAGVLEMLDSNINSGSSSLLTQMSGKNYSSDLLDVQNEYVEGVFGMLDVEGKIDDLKSSLDDDGLKKIMEGLRQSEGTRKAYEAIKTMLKVETKCIILNIHFKTNYYFHEFFIY